MLAGKDVAAIAAPSIALVPELGSIDAMVYCFVFSLLQCTVLQYNVNRSSEMSLEHNWLASIVTDMKHILM